MRVYRLFLAAAILLALLGASACRKRIKSAKPPKIGAIETGVASWYGHPYHGRRAANGEIYDMETLTAAHRTLPFGTWVRVENLSNKRTVEVRIQDRGPFINGRIIDLSKAGARNIEMLGPGTAKVRLTIIAPPRDLAKEPELFAVQVGAFSDRRRAESLRDSMRERYGAARLVAREGDSVLWRVLVGEKETSAEAQEFAEQLREAGNSGFVVRLDQPER